MAILDFDIEFTLRSSVRMEVPDTLKELSENDLRKLLMDCKYSIIKSIDKKDCIVVRESPKITKKPEFVNGAENNTRIGLTRLPTITLGVHPYRNLIDDVYKEEAEKEHGSLLDANAAMRILKILNGSTKNEDNQNK